MDEIENLLDSMRIAIQNEKFYQSENYLAMQEQIKSLEEKNNRLLMDNERLVEAGIHAQLGLWIAWSDLAYYLLIFVTPCPVIASW